MTKEFITDYGTIVVRNAMFESSNGTDTYEGIELKCLDNDELIEVDGYVDVDDMSVEDVELIIEQYNGTPHKLVPETLAKLNMSMNKNSEVDLDFSGTKKEAMLMLVTAMEGNEMLADMFNESVSAYNLINS